MNFSTICYRCRFGLVFIFLNLVLLDLIISKNSSDFIAMIISFLWIGIIVGFRLEAKFSIGGSLLFLLSAIPLDLIGLKNGAERLAVWCYLLLSIGVIQSLIEYKINGIHFRSLNDFIISLKKRNNKTTF